MVSFGGECVYAVESDGAAAAVYRRNWGMDPLGDLTLDADESTVKMRVPDHDVLVAGFPCQPFSKAGAQEGMDEARGALFWTILRVVQARKPEVVLLENVPNLAGRRHLHEWQSIVGGLRDQGYRLSEEPSLCSPNDLPPSHGGRPQNRPRVFITATRIPGGRGDNGERYLSPPPLGTLVEGWDRDSCRIGDWLDDANDTDPGLRLTPLEEAVVAAWADFVDRLRHDLDGRGVPAFPLWADCWVDDPRIPPNMDAWKRAVMEKNRNFYHRHREVINHWMERWWPLLRGFPPSRRRLEWQARDVSSFDGVVLQLRPSGVRCRPATYVPALVAMSQTSIIGERRRRLSAGEAARLQGLPDDFDFGNQRPALTFRQLGNAVNVGVVRAVFRQHVLRDAALLRDSAAGAALVDAVLSTRYPDLDPVAVAVPTLVGGDVAAPGGRPGRAGARTAPGTGQLELPLDWGPGGARGIGAVLAG